MLQPSKITVTEFQEAQQGQQTAMPHLVHVERRGWVHQGWGQEQHLMMLHLQKVQGQTTSKVRQQGARHDQDSQY
jgi:hypothetical protein